MDSPSTIVRLVGVYNAEGTLRGELTYWVGKRLGRAHCALCDITHGSVRERSDWRVCRDALPVPFDTYHADDQPGAVRSMVAGVLPAVLAETVAGYALLLGANELEACNGSPESLVASIQDMAHRMGLAWT